MENIVASRNAILVSTQPYVGVVIGSNTVDAILTIVSTTTSSALPLLKIDDGNNVERFKVEQNGDVSFSNSTFSVTGSSFTINSRFGMIFKSSGTQGSTQNLFEFVDNVGNGANGIRTSGNLFVIRSTAATVSSPNALMLTATALPQFMVGRPGVNETTCIQSNQWNLGSNTSCAQGSLQVTIAGTTALFDATAKAIAFKGNSGSFATDQNARNGSVAFMADNSNVASNNFISFLKTAPDGSANKDFVQFIHQSSVSSSGFLISIATGSAVAGQKGFGVTRNWELALRDKSLVATSSLTWALFAFNSSPAMTSTRTLTVDLSDADRTLDMTGNAVLNQDVSTTGSPTFNALTINGEATFNDFVSFKAGVNHSSGTPILPLSDGTFLYDSGQRSILMSVNGRDMYLPQILYTQTSASNITNTTTETSLFTTGIGTTTIPVNFLSVGKTIRITARGVYSTGATAPTLRIRVKYGNTIVGDTGAQTPASNLTGKYWELSSILTASTIGGFGTSFAQGMFTHSISDTAAAFWDLENSTSISLSTLPQMKIDSTAQWGVGVTSSEKIGCTNVVIEVLN